jgi:fermentation-respiration switch protein FrsA (DUF1100 family)
MGAVKEQSAILYAQKLAEQGFVTLALDLSCWGESEGEPRNGVLPDVFSEDFSAAVDFLGTRPFVDRNWIGVLGICGSGSFAISAAKIDPRMKAIATVSNRPITAEVKFMNFYPFNDIETISPRPMLFIAGENGHSREFSEEAYKLAGQPKVLVIVPGAGHVDLYDRVNLIPFDKLTKFFRDNLKYDESITSR